MSDTAVRVEGLSKQFTLGQGWRHDTLRDYLTRSLTTFSRRRQEPRRDRTLWALRDVSFEVKRGEVIGIIGRNGAGKSTLLKILSRITAPTAGYAEIRGRVGTLLEVGAGFHPELTGRENVYLSGAIMGMKKNEIDRKRDDIVAFAGVEQFIDTPVKRYSTGMYLRLAFAVAAHLDQEILFVDEVLAVGDAEFQRKCLEKMGQVSRVGRTVLFVSHNMGAVADLCPRALWLKDGRLELDGASTDVVSAYLSSSLGTPSVWCNPSAADPSSDGVLHLTSARVLSMENQPTAVAEFRNPVKIEIEYEVLRPLRDLSIIARVMDSIGHTLWTSWDSDGNGWKSGSVREPGRYLSACTIPSHLLRPGLYRVDLGAYSPEWYFPLHEGALRFEVSEVGYTLNPGRMGLITPVLKWEVRRIDGEQAVQPEQEPRSVRGTRVQHPRGLTV